MMFQQGGMESRVPTADGPEIGWNEGRIDAARSIGTRPEHLTTYLFEPASQGVFARASPTKEIPSVCSITRRFCKLSLTDLCSDPPGIACRVSHPTAAVGITLPLLRLLDGETTGVEGSTV